MGRGVQTRLALEKGRTTREEEMVCTSDVIRLARRHVAANAANESSARLCLADAVKCYDAGDFYGARVRALKSLKYSVGILSSVYGKAAD